MRDLIFFDLFVWNEVVWNFVVVRVFVYRYSWNSWLSSNDFVGFEVFFGSVFWVVFGDLGVVFNVDGEKICWVFFFDDIIIDG